MASQRLGRRTVGDDWRQRRGSGHVFFILLAFVRRVVGDGRMEKTVLAGGRRQGASQSRRARSAMREARVAIGLSTRATVHYLHLHLRKVFKLFPASPQHLASQPPER